eukprot:13541123-Alexandrium_andersonii.AAC.1
MACQEEARVHPSTQDASCARANWARRLDPQALPILLGWNEGAARAKSMKGPSLFERRLAR